MNLKFPLAGLLLAFCSFHAQAQQVFHDVPGLSAAVSKARPGDTLVLANGVYKDQDLVLTAKGDSLRSIVVRPETPGGATFSGSSVLRLGGTGIEVNGFQFIDGYAPKGAAWEYRNGGQLAQHCRITNSVIKDYNPANRNTEYSYILMYGRFNSLDHCTIGGKLNGGVTLAVILDEQGDLDNHHQIVYNHFAGRPNLGSNGGETIRVGTSQSSLQSSRTVIANNLFDNCDGEVEVVSIKSCDNIIRDNFFYESAGVLALRHGHRNLVEGNTFIGHNKPNTGGIRVINEGHIIRNNYLEGLAGDRFFAALAIMNAVPNSLPNRYHQVKDVTIENNAWVNCKNIQFCVGKDNERTLPPENVLMKDNIFVNASSPVVYTAYDKLDGFHFQNNRVVTSTGRYQSPGFKEDPSLRSKQIAHKTPDFHVYGASWYKAASQSYRTASGKVFRVGTGAHELNRLVAASRNGDVIEIPQEGTYYVDGSLVVDHYLVIRATPGLKNRPVIMYDGTKSGQAFITINDGGILELEGLAFDATSAEGKPSASAGVAPASVMKGHYSCWTRNCAFYNFTEGSYSAFKAKPGSYADTLVFSNCLFRDISGDAIYLSAEKDDAGKYSAEYTRVERCAFYKVLGYAVDVYRGGSDESTTGPTVVIDHCTLEDVNNKERGSGFRLAGAQNIAVTNNLFSNTGRGGASIRFDENSWDKIRVSHNDFYNSGRVVSFWGKVITGPVYKLKPSYSNALGYNFTVTNQPLTTLAADGHPIGYY